MKSAKMCCLGVLMVFGLIIAVPVFSHADDAKMNNDNAMMNNEDQTMNKDNGAMMQKDDSMMMNKEGN